MVWSFAKNAILMLGSALVIEFVVLLWAILVILSRLVVGF